MKNKNDVLACFKHFHKAIQTQYDAMVKALRSDDGTEYTNNALEEYLSTHGIHHQTTYPYTPAQNGIAERKNTVRKDKRERKVFLYILSLELLHSSAYISMGFCYSQRNSQRKTTN
jgi:transposase InsO family protein